MLTRLFELRQEVLLFVNKIKEDYVLFLVDELWLRTLAYLSDIFSKLNELNLCLQGNSLTILNAHFPGISVPSKSTIQEVVKKVCETGSVIDKKIKALEH